MNSFQERRAARVERFKRLAEQAQAESAGALARARGMLDVIPFGQPILIGHHSEGKDRRFRARIHDTFGKGFKLAEKAEYYLRRAESAGSSRTIFSDDPEALVKLREKLIDREQYQEKMVAINKAWRKAGKPRADNQAGWEAMEKDPELVAKNLGYEILVNMRASMAKDFLSRAPFTYHLTNNSGVIREIKKRITFLEQHRAQETKEHVVGKIRIVENVDLNRVQIFFPCKPSEEVRNVLKGRGFRWSRKEGAWQRHLNDYAVYLAKEIVGRPEE